MNLWCSLEAFLHTALLSVSSFLHTVLLKWCQSDWSFQGGTSFLWIICVIYVMLLCLLRDPLYHLSQQDVIDKVGLTSQLPYCFKSKVQNSELLAFYRHDLIIFNHFPKILIDKKSKSRKSKSRGDKSQTREVC